MPGGSPPRSSASTPTARTCTLGSRAAWPAVTDRRPDPDPLETPPPEPDIDTEAANAHNLIVVAVDDSDGSRVAQSWAAREAGLRGSRLVLLHVVDAELPGNPASAISYTEAVHEAVTPAEGLIDDVTARARAILGADADIVAEVAQGDPAQRLVEASAHADLLVVGTRGRGGIRSLVLGSVSQHCAQHAECPVVIVPPGARHDS